MSAGSACEFLVCVVGGVALVDEDSDRVVDQPGVIGSADGGRGERVCVGVQVRVEDDLAVEVLLVAAAAA